MEAVISTRKQDDAITRIYQEVVILGMRDYIKAVASNKTAKAEEIINDLKSDYLNKYTDGLAKKAAELLECDIEQAKINLEALDAKKGKLQEEA